jgi:hypothetical protein
MCLPATPHCAMGRQSVYPCGCPCCCQVRCIARVLDVISFEEAVVQLDAAQRAKADGRHEAKDEHLELAFQALAVVLDRQPDHAPSHNLLGLVMREQGQPRGAAACFASALRFQPEFPEVRRCGGAAVQRWWLTCPRACAMCGWPSRPSGSP